MQVGENRVVTIDYTLKDEKGEVLDSSERSGELSYIHGVGQLIPGLEEALEGHDEGEQVETTLNPQQAYGEYDDQLQFNVPKERMPEDSSLEVGQQFEAQTSQGQRQVVTLTSVGSQEVTLDANHPLAGQELTFDVTVKSVRDATQEELDHGHVHQEGENSDDNQ
jgi:FKBP-type peptidyl-prolyl cis-trans isomerase SlyD